MKDKIRAVLVDDHRLFLEGLSAMLQRLEHVEVVKTFSDPISARNYLLSNPVDLLITDLEMPKVSGMELIRKVKQVNKDVKIMVVSCVQDPKLIRETFVDSGVDAFLCKDSFFEEVRQAVDRIFSQGKSYLSSSIKEELLDYLMEEEDRPEPLTDRERVILRLICLQLTSGEISKALRISRHTVNNHRKSIAKKIGTSHILGMALYALKHQIVEELEVGVRP